MWAGSTAGITRYHTAIPHAKGREHIKDINSRSQTLWLKYVVLHPKHPGLRFGLGSGPFPFAFQWRSSNQTLRESVEKACSNRFRGRSDPAPPRLVRPLPGRGKRGENESAWKAWSLGTRPKPGIESSETSGFRGSGCGCTFDPKMS